MFISRTKVAVFGVALLGATTVYAETESKFSVGIDAGRAEAHKYCDRLVDCEDSDTSVRFDIGYEFNNIWSAEFGYTSFGTLLKSNDNNFNASQKANAWTLSAIATLPLSDRFGLYGRAGAARYSTNNSGTVQGVPVKDDTSIKPYFGVGVNFDLTRNLELRSEFQYYADISGVDGSKDDVQGLYVGAVFHF